MGALIIGAGFILPAMVAGGMTSSSNMDPKTADKVAQLATPCCMQTVITPIHLFGLNLYNQPVATANERVRAVMKTYPETTGVRMFRFLWAYGVGGLVNKELNQRARDWTVERYASTSNSNAHEEGKRANTKKLFRCSARSKSSSRKSCSESCCA